MNGSLGATELGLSDLDATIGAVARDLDLTASSLPESVKRAQADRPKGCTGLTTAEREELAQLRRDNRELRLERDIPRKDIRGLLREAPGLKFAWIAAEKATFPVHTMCRVLGVTPSGS